MNVLVIATHADDEVLGCGGVMARHADTGDRVHVAVVTRGDPEVFPPAYVEEIFSELRSAHQLLGGAGIHFLDFPSPRLDTVPGYVLADALRKLIFELQARVVYAPYQGDLHGDHQAVYQAALVASRPINGCPVRRLLCYETLSETDWASPFGNSTLYANGLCRYFGLSGAEIAGYGVLSHPAQGATALAFAPIAGGAGPSAWRHR